MKKLLGLAVAAILWILPVSAEVITITPGGGGGSFTTICTLASNTQVLYDNAGVCGSITGATTNGTTLTLVAPVLGTPASGTLTNTTGFPVANLAGAGTGVLTALGVNIGTAGAFVVSGGALGTPSSGTLTSATGLPISTGLTGAGTGVLTALGVNVGSAGAFVTFNGAGGTPSSMVGTNITGTAAGLTAGNVTTNANLTGPITSVGNVTSIASQTGTGTTFVVSAAPTITGAMAASGTLAVGGATIGANALAVTGTTLHTGNLTISSASLITSGNLSAAAWTTAGIRAKMAAASYTDTSSSGTVAAAYTDLFGAGTILASSATTYTSYYGAYFVAPIASTNVTMTNKSALGADTISIGGAAQGTDVLAWTGTATGSGQLNVGSVNVTSSSVPPNGIALSAANTVAFVSNSSSRFTLALNVFKGGTAGGPQIQNSAASATVPVFIPNQAATDAGIGANASGNVSFISGGAEIARVVSTGLNVIVTTDASASSGSGALQVPGGASVAKRFWIPAITTSAGLQTAVLCQSSGGEMIADSVACLASGSQFKTILGPMEDGALNKLIKLPMDRWAYKAEGNFKSSDWTRERIGPIAQDVAAMDKRIAGYDSNGNIRTFSTEQLLAFTIKAVQELNAKVDARR